MHTIDNKTNKVNEFNMVVLTLLNQLENITNISYISQFNRLIEANRLLPIEQFIVHALPLREKILHKDESYFSDEKNYDTDDESIINEILRLKNIYYTLDQESKNNMWDFLHAMLIVSDEYLKLKLSL